MVTKDNWKIRISGYGTFDFYGTEEEAEGMRINKAQWEGGNGMKWRSSLSTKEDIEKATRAAILDSGNGIPQTSL